MLSVKLSNDVEDRLSFVAQSTGFSEDYLINQALSQYLSNPNNYTQNETLGTNTPQNHEKKKKSRAGALAQYANPHLINQEKSAWDEAMREKHGHN